MGLLDSLPKSNLGLKGAKPANIPSSKKTSTLHFQSSINDKPDIKQSPSKLDLDGATPAKYLSNPPK
jgi:hypothetical protein